MTDTDILVWFVFSFKCFFKNIQPYFPFLQSSLIIQIDLNDLKLWEHNCSSGRLTAIELCPKQSAQLHCHKKKCHFIFKNKCLAQKTELKKKKKSQDEPAPISFDSFTYFSLQHPLVSHQGFYNSPAPFQTLVLWSHFYGACPFIFTPWPAPCLGLGEPGVLSLAIPVFSFPSLHSMQHILAD